MVIRRSHGSDYDDNNDDRDDKSDSDQNDDHADYEADCDHDDDSERVATTRCVLYNITEQRAQSKIYWRTGKCCVTYLLTVLTYYLLNRIMRNYLFICYYAFK